MAQVIKVDKVVNAEEDDLRIWWISNPPSPARYTLAESIDDAVQSLAILADLDIEDGVEVNVSGLEVFKDGEWEEWYDEDGSDIDGIIEQRGES